MRFHLAIFQEWGRHELFKGNELISPHEAERLAWQVTESAKQNPLQVVAESTEQVQAVIAFGARYYSGGPFQDPVKVLLKVRTPQSSSLNPLPCLAYFLICTGYNEIQTPASGSTIPYIEP